MLIPIFAGIATIIIAVLIGLFTREWEWTAMGIPAALVAALIGGVVADTIDNGNVVTETYTVAEWAQTDLRYDQDRVVVVQDENERVEVNRVLPGEGPWSVYAGHVNTVTYFLANP